jgi:hypothetical protein
MKNKKKSSMVNPEMVKKEADIVDVTNKVKAEVSKLNREEDKIRKEIEELNQQLVLNRLEAKANAKSEKTTGILCKMIVLANVMSTTYSQDSNLPGNHLFSDNELLEYKGKMLELLKQL